ncbi:sugar phosphate isomerase/epimerase family protein [Oceanobacillus iheyensis]|uniref:Xylose isomerase-like TIM barrel domain-containing protein n=1 Tax=Oceanobacillus iheyensis (strain DSM 14371 / CIP 107618 / JCM 11309 / KCTC 3954 / HTE831) TaxID=221109 RepID=Q8EL13_OCEIH|nr:sugar phosphate isomerase/epimerase family protein [Oceanobacillus iheyensis]BAC15375.1 hypothetical protein [Oceanobacillus iheyensis HTE831]
MRKGINQWCYPEGTPIEKVFSYSNQSNFHAVELNLSMNGPGLTMETTLSDVRKLKELASNYSIQLNSVSTDLLWKYPLSHTDKVIREKGRAVIEKQLEFAAELGANTILVVPGIVNGETNYKDCYDRSQEVIGKLIPLAEEKNVTIAIENVWNKFLLSPLEMASYVDSFSSKYVGVYFDVGNVLQFGYPEQWIEILSYRIKKVHVKDFDTKVGNISGFVPLLAGDVNWRSVIQSLNDIGYMDTLTAELTPYDFGPDLLARETSRSLDIIIEAG